MSVYEVGSFHLHAERLALSCRGKAVPVGRKVVETLLGLVEAGGPASKDALLERIWPDGFVEESNLAQNVYVLRKTFREYGDAEPIETVPGYGYRLITKVRPVAETSVNLQPKRRSVRPAWIAAALLVIATIPTVMTLSAGNMRHPTEPNGLSEDGARRYAIGRYYWNLRTAAAVQKSMQYFSQVIDRDPRSALGYVGMADANESMGDYCYGTHRPSVYFARARAFAMQAVSMDRWSAPAHASLGFVALHQHQGAVAAAEFRRAIELDPAYAAAHEWYGIALVRQNNVLEGSRQLRLAARLDPLSVATLTWLSRVAFRDGQLADARTYQREAGELSPELTGRRGPPGHPSWASIENAEHLGPTVLRSAAYGGHESFSAPLSGRGAPHIGGR